MTQRTDQLIAHLTALDPAPRRPLTASEIARSETLLTAILATPSEVLVERPVRRSRERSRVRLFAGISAGALAMGAAALTLGLVAPHLIDRFAPTPPETATYLSTASLTSWTGTPARLDATSAARSAATQWCLDGTAKAGGAAAPVISNADLRGSVSSMIISRGDHVSFCIVGSDNTGLWESLTSASAPAKPVAAGTISLESAGSHGDGSTGFTYAEGLVGTGVSAVTLSDGGKTIDATVDSGRWTAWWPTADPHGEATGPTTVTRSDGSTTTITAAELNG